jgi:hypothetical protein
VAARDIFQAASAQRADLGFELANTLGWIAKAREAQGDLAGALAAQRDKFDGLLRLPGAATDRRVQRLMANAVYEQGRMQLFQGDTAGALVAAQDALVRFEALSSLDPQNMYWRSETNLARLALAEVRLARDERATARSLLADAEADSARWMSDSATRVTWRLMQRGQALRLRLALADPWPTRREALAAYVAQVREAEAAGLLLDVDQRLLAAAIELGLSEALARAGDARAARDAAQTAAARVREASRAGHPAASTLLAQALWRLGEITEAQALARRVADSAYRHPDFADLQRRLASGEGAASFHDQ